MEAQDTRWRLTMGRTPLYHRGLIHPPHFYSDWDNVDIDSPQVHVRGNLRTQRKRTQQWEHTSSTQTITQDQESIFSLINVITKRRWTKRWTKWHYSRTGCTQSTLHITSSITACSKRWKRTLSLAIRFIGKNSHLIGLHQIERKIYKFSQWGWNSGFSSLHIVKVII